MGTRFPKLVKLLLFLILVVFAGVTAATPDSSKQPVLIFLYAKITDHINTDLAESRLRHLLPALEEYREEFPASHVTATVLFTGASSDALAERNSKTHIVDFVKDYIRHGVIEAGYDGENEPTYKNRPTLDFSNAKSIDDRWLVRAHAEEKILTQARDPLTGALEAGKDGGLKRMQEVFGQAAYISGLEAMLDNSPRRVGGATTAAHTPADTIKNPPPTFIPETGGDSEALPEIHRINDRAILVGLPEDNPAHIPGFGGGEEAFLRLISPDGQTPPEVYWQDNILRLSEVSNTSEAAEEATEEFKGLSSEDLKDDLKELNRSRIQVVRVELADERYYLQPAFTKDDHYPLQYAYDHQASPKLPADQLKNTKDVEAAYSKEEGAIKWLAQEFFVANPGSHFVTSSELKEMAGSSAGYAISMDALRRANKAALEKWGNDTYPVPYLHVGDRYLSLADWFQVLTDAFAEFDRTGKLPESVHVVPVYGPMYTPTGHGPNDGEATVASIAHAAAGIDDRLHDTSAGLVPKNSIPITVDVSGRLNLNSDAQGQIKMSAAQFLRLMAAALDASSPDTEVRVKMTYMYPGQAILWPKTRAMTETGALWTIKPAVLDLGSKSQTTQGQK